MSWYAGVRYRLVPTVFPVVFSLAALSLPFWGQRSGLGSVTSQLFEREKWRFSLLTVSGFTLWALASLKLSSKEYKGPPDPSGFIPVYKDNGVAYYVGTMLLVVTVELLKPGFCGEVYQSVPQILMVLSLFAFLLCFYLYVGNPESPYPRAYQFYSGVRLHPRFLGVDVKQLTNCRIGVMSWQVLVAIYWYHGLSLNGFNIGAFTNFCLQSLYLFGFFVWESGYFHTLDITTDRAGYYLCWGCLVWVPSLYTFSAYWFVGNVPKLGTSASLAALGFGLVFLLFKFLVDFERVVFRSTGKLLWGRQAAFIKAPYTDDKGRSKTSQLITNGFWGGARHLNYTFELLSTLCWSLPGLGLGQGPLLYFYFLLILLVHRLFRDEEKCSAKYAKKWEEYCKAVPYRLIPYIF